jgi:uncharacterized membrane protein
MCVAFSGMKLPWRAIGPAALFLTSGTLHFARPALFRAIVPPQFGHEVELVAISGVAEIAGGLGLLYGPTRRPAAYGLVALLLAVWPANWYMAIVAGRYAAVAPAWLLWARVPLQVPLIWWVIGAARGPR